MKAAVFRSGWILLGLVRAADRDEWVGCACAGSAAGRLAGARWLAARAEADGKPLAGLDLGYAERTDGDGAPCVRVEGCDAATYLGSGRLGAALRRELSGTSALPFLPLPGPPARRSPR